MRHDRRGRRGPIAVAAAVLVGLAVLVPASPAAADVDSVAASATGVEITGDAGVIAPTPTVSLSADETSPPAALGPFTDTEASVVLPSPFPFNLFSTGPLAVAVSAGGLAGEDPTGFVEARALVQTVALGPNFATATSIASSCTANDAATTGATVIQGGMLYGQPFPPTPTPAPNTVVPVEGLGTVTLNEQLVTSGIGPTGEGLRRIVVNAVHARFTSAAAGGILPRDQQAEAVIGQVVCEASSTAAPPTTTTTVAPTTTTTVAPTTTTTVAPTTTTAAPPTTTTAAPPTTTTTVAPTTTTTVAPTTPTATVPTTSPPPTDNRGQLPETGGDDLLALGLLAVAGGSLLRLALRRVRSRPG